MRGFKSWLVRLTGACWLCCALLAPRSAHSEPRSIDTELRRLASEDRSELGKAIDALGRHGDVRALPVLQALSDGALRVDAAGSLYIKGADGKLRDALSGGPANAPSGTLRTPTVDNRLRRALLPAIGSLSLSASELRVRLSAAQELSKRPSDEVAPVMREALGRETDARVRELLAIGLAQIDLQSDKPEQKLAALKTIEAASDVSFKPQLEQLLTKNPDGSFVEKNAEVRSAA